MGYSGDYSLLSRCISEAFATFTFVFFALTILANKLLPKTKGHDLSYGWLAFGVGLAVFIPVQFMGFISTSLNPAMALGSALVGHISLLEWPLIALSEMLGALCGALLMYLYYYPQFRTEPEPPPQGEAERLLRTRDDIGRRGLDYVSYNTREPPIAPRFPREIPNHLRHLRRRVSHTIRRTPLGSLVYRTADVLGRDATMARPNRRRSVTIADLHHRLDRLQDIQTLDSSVSARCHSETENGSRCLPKEEIYVQMLSNNTPQDLSDLNSIPEQESTSMLDGSQRSNSFNGFSIKDCRIDAESVALNGLASEQSAIQLDTVNENENGKEKDPLLDASRLADRNMKLAIFCTRPSTYCPLINLTNEAVSTFFLVIGILFIKERSELLYDGYDDLYRHGMMSMYIGLLISLLVLCLGGMGVAMNPARDLAPRIAHWLLPIAGKGPSEWYYAWIPIVGPFAGSVIAAFVFKGMTQLNKNVNEGGLYDQDFRNLSSLFNETQ